ncbi:hypothetical protein [Winogradskyella forsetii]|uniref:hypothetical protein n=1 Tax=Winogradskyella forsetii TaxID=2686077 RepID=UPI0015BC8FCD|nr:hypothetical protein [Winogradskyella forsetii]
MNKENILLILWIIFGFVFVIAVESILYFIIHLLYFGLAELGVSYNVMTYVFPIITLIFYSLTALFLLNRIKSKSIAKTSGIYLTEFPKKLLIILALVVFILTPLTNKLSGMYAESASENTLLEMGEYLIYYGWFNLGFAISQTLVLIAMVGFSLIKLKEINKN